MKFLLSVLKCLIVGVIIAKTQRPNFRGDYRYEKAFNAFYKVHTIAQEWHTARLRCEAEGTELMVPDNLDEADVLPLLTTDVLTKYEGVYVGMHDMYSERIYVTLNGSIILGSILDLFWEFKEPKYGGGRCVAMRRSGRLFVHPCEDPLPFICKISAAKVTFNQECNTYNLNWTAAPNKSCYLVHTEPQNWRDAYSTCLLGGGYLAVLDNRAEAEYIKHLFKQVEEKRMPSNDIAFLGFNDLFQQHHYRTVFGVPIQNSGFADWDMKCSASAERNKSHQKRCGGLRRSGLLVVEDCEIPAMFFCEKPANKSTARTGLRSRNHYYT